MDISVYYCNGPLTETKEIFKIKDDMISETKKCEITGENEEIKSYVFIAGSSRKLKQLYSQGWKLITATPYQGMTMMVFEKQ